MPVTPIPGFFSNRVNISPDCLLVLKSQCHSLNTRRAFYSVCQEAVFQWKAFCTKHPQNTGAWCYKQWPSSLPLTVISPPKLNSNDLFFLSTRANNNTKQQQVLCWLLQLTEKEGKGTLYVWKGGENERPFPFLSKEKGYKATQHNALKNLFWQRSQG